MRHPLGTAAVLLLLATVATTPASAQAIEGIIPAAELPTGSAFSATLQWGTITARPSADGALRYRIVRETEGPKRDSLERLPKAIPYRLHRDAAGHPAIEVRPRDAEPFIAAALELWIPAHVRFLRLEIANAGQVNVVGVKADLSVKSRAGDVRLEDVRGPIIAEALSGEIRVSLATTEPTAPVVLLARNGGVRLGIPRGAGMSLDIETRSGAIESALALQRTDLPGLVRSAQYRPRRATAVQGSGRPVIRVLTLNGDVTVREVP